MPVTTSHELSNAFRYYSEVIKTQIRQPHIKRNIVVVFLFYILMFTLGYFYNVNNGLMIFRTTIIQEALQQNINPYQVDKSTVLDLLKQNDRNYDFGEYHIDQASFQYLIDIPLSVISNTSVRSGMWMLTISFFISFILWDVVFKPKRNQKINLFGFLSIFIFLFISLTQDQQYSGLSILLLTCIIKLNESLEKKANVVAGISAGLMILVAHDWLVILVFAFVFIALNKEYKILLWAVLTIFIIILITQLVFPNWLPDFLNIIEGKYKAAINLWVNSIKTFDFLNLKLLLKASLFGFLVFTLISNRSNFEFGWGTSIAICILVLIINQPFRYLPLMLFPLIKLMDTLLLQYPHIHKKINIGACIISAFFLFLHIYSKGINSNSNSTMQILLWIPTLALFILLNWFKPFNKLNKL